MTKYAPMISALITLLLTFIMTLSKTGTIQDIPNERSLHTEPIPRTGGIALMIGIMSGWVVLFNFWSWWIVLPMLGLFLTSLIDDKRSLSAKTRLICHFAAAIILMGGAGIDWKWQLPILLIVVWMTNLFNFMDGSDGLAAGMALFGFSFYGIVALVNSDENFAMINFSIGAAALGFLYHNFHPAKIFLGDSGSIPLGFLAAAFGILGWQREYWPFWFPLLVFSPFVIDATVTLINRTVHGKRITEAHRNHYYQRLIRMGWGHERTAIVEYVLMFLAGVSAWWAIGKDIQSQWDMFACWGAIYLGIAMWVDRRWRLYEEKQQKAGDA